MAWPEMKGGVTGGVGYSEVREFYSTYFISGHPADTEVALVARTVGTSRIELRPRGGWVKRAIRTLRRVLLSIGGRGRADTELSLTRVIGWGALGSAIVQLAYLGHGDQGLAANIKMALLFCAFGGVVTMGWLVMARRWAHRRSSLQPSS